ncbi:MAG: hypothetical protein GXY86_07330 [Firmicutes bacterium]|nr:hypothetical protein [Bacillota bacterium]
MILNTGFGPYSITMLIISEVRNYREAGLAVDHLGERLQQAFARENIQLPFLQQHIEVKRGIRSS